MRILIAAFLLAISYAQTAGGVRLLDRDTLQVVTDGYGILQMDVGDGKWKYVCDDVFSYNSNGANVACKELGYTTGTWFRVSTSDSDMYDDVNCDGTESTLAECPRVYPGNCDYTEGIGLSCTGSNSVRLVNEDTGAVVATSGEVEVTGVWQMNTGDGDWLYIGGYGENGFAAAYVFCKELGFDVPAHPITYYRSDWSAGQMSYGVECDGSEGQLRACTVDKAGYRSSSAKVTCKKVTQCTGGMMNEPRIDYSFTLKGTNGDEQVTVKGLNHDDTDDYLTKSEMVYITNCFITVEFLNDAYGRDVIFKAQGYDDKLHVDPIPVDYKIVARNNWPGWRCGQPNQDQRCIEVQAGQFKWNDVYEITFNPPTANSETAIGSETAIAFDMHGRMEYALYGLAIIGLASVVHFAWKLIMTKHSYQEVEEV